MCRMAQVQGQLRCLDPHVLSLLGQVQCAALPQAALAPAALLMEELHGKLVEAMTRARRPAFLNAAAAQAEPTGELYAITQRCCFFGQCCMQPGVQQLHDIVMLISSLSFLS